MLYIYIDHFNLILPSKLGINCAEDPLNMGMVYNSRCHSKWVCFQIPNTHIQAFFYIGVAPPPPPPGDVPLLFISLSTSTTFHDFGLIPVFSNIKSNTCLPYLLQTLVFSNSSFGKYPQAFISNEMQIMYLYHLKASHPLCHSVISLIDLLTLSNPESPKHTAV